MSTASSLAPLPLADVHLPAAPGVFPLAWGWWLVIISLLVLFTLAAYLLRQRRNKRQAQKIALKALENCQSIAEINLLLKRVALSYFAKNEVAPLTGLNWLSFLDAQLNPKQQGFIAMQTDWIEGAFSAKACDQQVLAQAKAQAKVWLKHAPTNHRKEQQHA